jgi:hypothetical protein
MLDILIVYLVRILWRLRNLLRSRRWNRVNATVLSSQVNESPFGNSVTVDYEYEVDGQKWPEAFIKPFILHSSAKVYADEYPRGAMFKIRIQPGCPDVSVADKGVEHWWY